MIELDITVETTEKVHLHHCYCGSGNLEIILENYGDLYHQVVCRACCARGSASKDNHAAVSSWNKLMECHEKRF